MNAADEFSARNSKLLLEFYAKHNKENATAEKVKRLLSRYSVAQLKLGLMKLYGSAPALEDQS